MNSRKSSPISYLDDGLFWAESGFFITLLGKPVILLAKEGTRLPLDLSQYQCIFYSSIYDLRAKLIKALKDMGMAD